MANTPNQPPQGNQPQAQQQAQHAALTAAGVPQEHAATLAQAGVTPDQFQKLSSIQGFNIGGLLQLIQQYGPQAVQMIQAIIAMFGK